MEIVASLLDWFAKEEEGLHRRWHIPEHLERKRKRKWSLKPNFLRSTLPVNEACLFFQHLHCENCILLSSPIPDFSKRISPSEASQPRKDWLIRLRYLEPHHSKQHHLRTGDHTAVLGPKTLGCRSSLYYSTPTTLPRVGVGLSIVPRADEAICSENSPGRLIALRLSEDFRTANESSTLSGHTFLAALFFRLRQLCWSCAKVAEGARDLGCGVSLRVSYWRDDGRAESPRGRR